MNFLSMCFILALPIIFLLYNFIPGKLRMPLLLLSSWGFYLYGNPESFWILILITVISYLFGLIVDSKKSLPVLITGILAILSFLLIFKYSGLNFILPIGISFYTFQTLSYLIDVYKGTYKAERNFFDYSLFVSFFPQLVAGPIERPGKLIPQLKSCKNPSSSNLKEAVILLSTGYYKKIVVADFVAPFVNHIFESPSSFEGAALLFGSVMFSVQIYADFSGYSDIARGCAKLFGIDLSMNFDHPYLSKNLREFWRRWHITLTRWFTDYIYIPLGGSRKGKKRAILNTLIVFLVSGIWHGYGLTFILWGLGHGIVVLLEDINVIKKLRSKLPSYANIIINFLIVNFLWIFFRARNLGDAKVYICKLFSGWQNAPSSLADVFTSLSISTSKGLIFIALGAASLYLLPQYLKKKIPERNIFACIFLMILITLFSKMYQIESGIENSFIYFRF
ncbi:MAG: MBOAT family protein [Butyrivibrio sp.]|nr:MBOAT family protein [Butyrivibrio sp.]